MMPIAGAWRDEAAAMDLQTPEKNPMSLVVDRDRLIVSDWSGRAGDCSD